MRQELCDRYPTQTPLHFPPLLPWSQLPSSSADGLLSISVECSKTYNEINLLP